MARPGPTPTSPNQGGLFGDDEIPPDMSEPGPVERAIRAATGHQTEAGALTAADEGAAEFGAKLAASIDRAGGAQAAYKLAKVGPVMLDWLDRMYMNPAARRDIDDDDAARFQELLSELSRPVDDAHEADADAGAAIPHREDAGA